MKQLKLEITLDIIDDYKKLSEIENKLCEAAVQAKDNAYAIYSNFQVGAALLLENGVIVLGSNQENAVYPLGLCAERVAIFAAGHQYPNTKIKKIALATAHQEEENQLPVFPCGSCRHVIREQEVRFDTKIEVLVVDSHRKVYRMASIQDILPFAFDKKDL